MRVLERSDPEGETVWALMFIRMTGTECHVTASVLNHTVGSAASQRYVGAPHASSGAPHNAPKRRWMQLILRFAERNESVRIVARFLVDKAALPPQDSSKKEPHGRVRVGCGVGRRKVMSFLMSSFCPLQSFITIPLRLQ